MMMRLQFPTKPPGSDAEISRKLHLNIDTLGAPAILGTAAMNYPLVPNSTHVTVNTDTSSQQRTTSSFICHKMPSFYSITRVVV